MKAKDIRLNQLVEIEIEFDSGIEHLPSRVEGIERDHLHISMPMRKAAFFPLRLGQEIKVIVKHKNSSFAFFSNVVGRSKERIPLLIINKPKNFIQVPQKRTYVRLEIALPINFKVLSEEGDAEIKKGITLDISAGGALFLTPADIEEKQDIEIEIELAETQWLNCRAKVVRILSKAKKEGDNNKVAIEYEGINEGQRDRVFKYIFEKQRERIKKGVLE
jgi:c-di-GMP-binding flagellar brake protein YcgR